MDPAEREERIVKLEEALQLDDRLSRIEKRFGPTGGRGWIVATVGIVSAVLPLMEWIQGYQAKDRELEIVESEQRHNTQKTWLEMAVRQDLPHAAKQRILRFLATTLEVAQMRTWAQEELKIVDKIVEEVERERDVAKTAAEAARAEIDSLRILLLSSANTNQSDLDKANKDLRDALRREKGTVAKIADLEAKLETPAVKPEKSFGEPKAYYPSRDALGVSLFSTCEKTTRGSVWDQTDKEGSQQICLATLRGTEARGSAGLYAVDSQYVYFDEGLLFWNLKIDGVNSIQWCQCSPLEE